MNTQREDLQNQPYFYDDQDSVIQDEPYEPTGEMAYRQKTKCVKKPEKKSKQKKERDRE